MSQTHPTNLSDLLDICHNSGTGPHKPAHLGPIARQEWDRLVFERRGLPRTLPARIECWYCGQAVDALSFLLMLQQWQATIPAPFWKTVYGTQKRAYVRACVALNCTPALPIVRTNDERSQAEER